LWSWGLSKTSSFGIHGKHAGENFGPCKKKMNTKYYTSVEFKKNVIHKPYFCKFEMRIWKIIEHELLPKYSNSHVEELLQDMNLINTLNPRWRKSTT
jgi:hypothetical protein